MRSLRVLVVDDERLARVRMKRLLGEYKWVEVVAEAESVESARLAAQEYTPDVVFLDVQMPGATGFELLPHLSTLVKVIFVTAFDEYAVRAFEVNALDYLQKPITKKRLAKTLERLEGERETEALSRDGMLRPSDSILIEDGSTRHLVQLADVLYLGGADDYTAIHRRDGNTLLSRVRLKAWETRLASAHFLRIHRATLINLSCIVSWSRTQVILQGVEEPLGISRGRQREVAALLDGLKT